MNLLFAAFGQRGQSLDNVKTFDVHSHLELQSNGGINQRLLSLSLWLREASLGQSKKVASEERLRGLATTGSD
jgi:hypothetical protein